MGSAHDCMCDTGIFLARSPVCRDKISHLNPELANPLVQLASLLARLCLPTSGILGSQQACQAFTWLLGGQTLALMFGQQALYMLRSLAPACLLIDLAGPWATDQFLQ